MQDRYISINGIEFPISWGTPFEYDGVHSGGALSGIILEGTIYYDDEISQIKELIKEDTVKVEDPFTGRTFEATIRRESESYQVGRPGRLYKIEVKELDMPERFDVLEIEGHRFSVINNSETLRNESIGLHVLLHLSEDEFMTFRTLLKLRAVQIRRLGIDEVHMDRRFGGAMYWSSHEEDSVKSYKQIVRFFPVDYPTSRVAIADGHTQGNQSRMLLTLSARFESLVANLVDSGLLSKEEGESLITEEWRDLLDDERAVSLAATLYQVDDAESELD